MRAGAPLLNADRVNDRSHRPRIQYIIQGITLDGNVFCVRRWYLSSPPERDRDNTVESYQRQSLDPGGFSIIDDHSTQDGRQS